MARSTHRHIARASDPSSLTSFAVTTVAVLHGCWRPRTLSLSPPQAAHFYSWGRCAYGSLRRARARYVCMRRVGPDGRGGVGRGRVACWASVATVAMCRHDPYSIYLMFAIVALSPDALECPGKYVYHRFGLFAQCEILLPSAARRVLFHQVDLIMFSSQLLDMHHTPTDCPPRTFR